MQKKLNRRQMLKLAANTTGLVAVSPFLNSCAYFDRLILGDSNDDTQRVVILGGGGAGLMAAYQLKRKGIPFRLFEGSNRIGGRAYTLDSFNVAEQSVELGAEWISSDHEIVFNLAKELRVLISESRDMGRAPALIYQGQPVAWETLRQDLRSLSLTWPRYELSAWDTQSAASLFRRWGNETSASSLFWLKRWVQWEWGVDPEQISAAQVLRQLQSERDVVQSMLNRRYRINGGTQVLLKALQDRISGVIPDRFIKKDHKLIAIRERSGYMLLVFDTAFGRREVKASVIICALPFSALREVDGIEDLEFTPGKAKIISGIGYGSHSKVVASYQQRFWRQQKWTPRTSLDSENQWLWESSLQLTPLTAANRGLMTAQLAGQLGANAGLHSVDTLNSELNLLVPQQTHLEKSSSELSHVMNWSKYPWARGSVAYFKPGQWVVWADRLGESHYRGYWIFAGEHTAPKFPGTFAGALESGVVAADKVMAMQLKFSETRDG